MGQETSPVGGFAAGRVVDVQIFASWSGFLLWWGEDSAQSGLVV